MIIWYQSHLSREPGNSIDWWFTQKSLGCWGGVAPELAPRVSTRDKRRETGGSDSTGAEGCGWTDWHLQGSSESWPKKWEKHGLLMTEYSHMCSLCVYINTYKDIVIAIICLCINQFFMIINTKTCIYIYIYLFYSILYLHIYTRILIFQSIFQHILLCYIDLPGISFSQKNRIAKSTSCSLSAFC